MEPCAVVVAVDDRRRVPSGRNHIDNGSLVGARVERPRGRIDTGRVGDVAVLAGRRNDTVEDVVGVRVGVSIVGPRREASTAFGSALERGHRGVDTCSGGVSSRLGGVDRVRDQLGKVPADRERGVAVVAVGIIGSTHRANPGVGGLHTALGCSPEWDVNVANNPFKDTPEVVVDGLLGDVPQ
jgi:hypothetical protein